VLPGNVLSQHVLPQHMCAEDLRAVWPVGPSGPSGEYTPGCSSSSVTGSEDDLVCRSSRVLSRRTETLKKEIKPDLPRADPAFFAP
jgi:hypothetical protein